MPLEFAPRIQAFPPRTLSDLGIPAKQGCCFYSKPRWRKVMMTTRMMQSEIDSPCSRTFGSRLYIDRHLPIAVWQAPPDPSKGNSAEVVAAGACRAQLSPDPAQSTS